MTGPQRPLKTNKGRRGPRGGARRHNTSKDQPRLPHATSHSTNQTLSSASGSPPAMAPPMSLRFLGTSSMPSLQRNYSSLLVNFGSETIMVDCGEGTQQRLMQFVGPGKLSMIKTILITHLHMDHVLGLVPLLSSLSMSSGPPKQDNNQATVNIYGPLGLRALIRTQLQLCYASLNIKYAVHELIWPSQKRDNAEAQVVNPPYDTNRKAPLSSSFSSSSSLSLWKEPDTPMPGAFLGPQRILPLLPRDSSFELPGTDIVMDEHTCTWPAFATLPPLNVSLSAAPILHRCPALAYVFSEPSATSPLPPDTFQRLDANAQGLLSRDGIRNPRSLVGRLLKDRQTLHLPDGTTMSPPPINVPGRKLTICGDTYDASGALEPSRGLQYLAQNSTVLVHECTNASISPQLTKSKHYTVEETRERAQARGHSTPQVAGEFAAAISAQAVLLNHFSVRYSCPPAHVMATHFPASNMPARPTSRPASDARFAPPPIHSRGDERSVGGKLAILEDIADQTTKSWHDGMQHSSQSSYAALPQDDTLTTRKAVLDAELWKHRRAIPTWDGFEYHVHRDDEFRI